MLRPFGEMSGVPAMPLARPAGRDFGAEAEQSLLGALLLDNQAFNHVACLITCDDFCCDEHRRIWRHIRKLIEAGTPADMITVSDSIEASEDKGKTGGAAYLGSLAQNTPSALNIKRYAELVREKAMRRKLAAVGAELQERAAHGDLEEVRRDAENRLAELQPQGARLPVLDLAELSGRHPEHPPFIIPDWLPCGYVSLLAGHGGVGKSTVALLISVCIASGVPFFGLQVSRRRVMYLSCEDRANVLHWRLARVCSHLGIDLLGLSGWLHIVDLVGRESVLWERDLRTGHSVTPTYRDLTDGMHAHKTEVLIVDGAADTFGGNENSRTEVKRYVNALVALIPADRGAVLLLGHIAKPTASNGTTSEGYSGSTAWHNSVRARWYLHAEMQRGEDGEGSGPTGDVILELQKSNLARAERSLRFRWHEAAQLFLATEAIAATRVEPSTRDRLEQDGILAAFRACATADPPIIVPAAMQGPRTALHVLAPRPEFPQSLRSWRYRRRFWRLVEKLRHLHLVDEVEYRRKNRHIGAQLVLTSEGMRQCAT